MYSQSQCSETQIETKTSNTVVFIINKDFENMKWSVFVLKGKDRVAG